MAGTQETVTAKVKRSFSYTFSYHPGDDFEATEQIVRDQAAAGNVFLPEDLAESTEKPGNAVQKEEKEEKTVKSAKK